MSSANSYPIGSLPASYSSQGEQNIPPLMTGTRRSESKNPINKHESRSTSKKVAGFMAGSLALTSLGILAYRLQVLSLVRPSDSHDNNTHLQCPVNPTEKSIYFKPPLQILDIGTCLPNETPLMNKVFPLMNKVSSFLHMLDLQNQ